MSKNKTDRTGGPAFPQLKHLIQREMEYGGKRLDAETIGGMTLRQWYAGMAVNALRASDYADYGDLAHDAVALADALIKAEKEP